MLAALLVATAAPHIVFLIGESEYKSEQTLPPIAHELETKHNVRCTLLFSSSPTNLPGLQALDSADAVVMFMRFRDFPDDQMAKIKAYLNKGKPVAALRTSTHAFNNWKEFGELVLGSPWRYHYGHESSTDVTVTNPSHPIMKGVDPTFHVRSWLYYVLPLPAAAQPLAEGKSIGPSDRKERAINPVAWTSTYKGARVFYTSMGHPDDFQLPAFRTLLINGILWTLGK